MRITPNEFIPEKINGKLPASEPETQNRKIVKALYKALVHGDTETIARFARLVASELEWWYHGPPQGQHMMHILTGQSRNIDFKFKPWRIKAIGDRVIVEGWEGPKAYWVHVWTLKDGIIAQLREYFNTWLAVIVRGSEDGDAIQLWQSEPKERLNYSFPDLVLAI